MPEEEGPEAYFPGSGLGNNRALGFSKPAVDLEGTFLRVEGGAVGGYEKSSWLGLYGFPEASVPAGFPVPEEGFPGVSRRLGLGPGSY